MKHSSAGASVEKIGEAAACAVKRLHLDHRMVQVSCLMKLARLRPCNPRAKESVVMHPINGLSQGCEEVAGLDERRVAFSCQMFSPLCRPRRASA